MTGRRRAPVHGPEWHIQQAIIKKLRGIGWHVVVTHGNEFQQGLPDLLIFHNMYGTRMVEVKNPKAYKFTPAQWLEFPKIHSHGGKIYVLISDSDDEIAKIHGSPNFHHYMRNFKGVS